MSRGEFEHHLSNGLSAVLARWAAGSPVIEYCVQFDPIFDQVSYRGVPDVRIIVFLGYPVERSAARACPMAGPIHQGAIGVGIDIPTGLTRRGVWGTEIIREHPDTEHSIVGLQIALAGAAADGGTLLRTVRAGLRRRGFRARSNLGPMITELNARPARPSDRQRQRLGHRLAKVEALAGRVDCQPIRTNAWTSRGAIFRPWVEPPDRRPRMCRTCVCGDGVTAGRSAIVRSPNDKHLLLAV